MSDKNAILVTPKFGGRAHILGPYSDQELAQKMKSLSTKYDHREAVKVEKKPISN